MKKCFWLGRTAKRTRNPIFILTASILSNMKLVKWNRYKFCIVWENLAIFEFLKMSCSYSLLIDWLMLHRISVLLEYFKTFKNVGSENGWSIFRICRGKLYFQITFVWLTISRKFLYTMMFIALVGNCYKHRILSSRYICIEWGC